PKGKLMDDKELNIVLFAGAFEPKRIHLTNGQTYDILRPGQVAIGRRTTTVIVEGRPHQISNLHIADVEPVQPVTQ
ncbi:MAG TPA: hypothetical protein VFW73_04450, partial [Lacipirellulaceae bacterium]|nr:hypothetical protein [Lacipirellulaceae bacterium]